jgi:hypothetical protein
MLGNILGWLGFGGVVSLVAVAYLAPAVLPGALVKTATAALEASAAATGWLLGQVADGAQYIAGRNSAVITLAVAIVIGGVIGDRYDPVRSYLPAWLRSDPPASARPPPRSASYWPAAGPETKAPAPARRNPSAPTRASDPLRDIFCSLGGC